LQEGRCGKCGRTLTVPSSIATGLGPECIKSISKSEKRDNFLDEFIQATPRIALAIIIAIVISKPLEIKIFEKEINTVLLKEKNEMMLANKKQVANYFQSDLDKNKAQIDSLKSDILKKEKLYFYYDKNYAFIYKGKKFNQTFERIVKAKAGSQSKKWKEFLAENLFKEDFCVVSTSSKKLNEFGLNRALLSIHSDSTHFLIKTGVTRKFPLNLSLKEKGFCFEKNQESSSFLNLHMDITQFRENPDDEFIQAFNKYAKRIAFPTKEFLDAWEGDISFIQGGLTNASETYIETQLDEEFNPIEVRKTKLITVPKYSIMLSMNDKKTSFFDLLKQKGILTLDGASYRFLTSPLLAKKEYENYTIFNSGDQYPKIVESTENTGFQFWNGKKYDFLIKSIEDTFILGEFKIQYSDVENYLKSI
jgi:hypothetical protein